MNENIKEVQLFKDDFRVILMALLECQTAWRGMIDEGEIPDVPGLDKEFPSDSPHSAWRWVTGGFTRVFDRIGKDPK